MGNKTAWPEAPIKSPHDDAAERVHLALYFKQYLSILNSLNSADDMQLDVVAPNRAVDILHRCVTDSIHRLQIFHYHI